MNELDLFAAAVADPHQREALLDESGPLAAILADNKKLLITQNMLDQGHSRPEAEMAVQTILDVLGKLKEFALRIADEPGTLAIDTTLRW